MYIPNGGLNNSMTVYITATVGAQQFKITERAGYFVFCGRVSATHARDSV